VTIAGNWAGSNLVAGIETSGTFGMAGDLAIIPPKSSIIPTIASIIIRGNVKAAPLTGIETDAGPYGFDAGKIGSFSVDGTTLTYPTGSIENVDNSGDTNLEEVT
jgi:hypothetical protein